MTYVRWLHRGVLPRADIGGKGASLSELFAGGYSVPVGFAVCADAYRRFEEASGLSAKIPAILDGLDYRNAAALKSATSQIESVLAETPLPEEVAEEAAAAYTELASMSGEASAVRSSAVGEDGTQASFAGLYESYLNVRGVKAILKAVHACYLSLWSDRAVRYRALRGGGATGESMAVVVMGLVPSDVSGIAFTAHPVTGETDRVLINASWGLGEAIVSGRVTPDSFTIRKAPFEVLDREVYEKELMIQPHPDGQGTIELHPDASKAAAACLSDEMALEIARLAAEIESRHGCPQDIEFGIAGGELYLLQSRPITTLG